MGFQAKQALAFGVQFGLLDALPQAGHVRSFPCGRLEVAAQASQGRDDIVLPLPHVEGRVAGTQSMSIQPATPQQLGDLDIRFVLQRQAGLLDAVAGIEVEREVPERLPGETRPQVCG